MNPFKSKEKKQLELEDQVKQLEAKVKVLTEQNEMLNRKIENPEVDEQLLKRAYDALEQRRRDMKMVHHQYPVEEQNRLRQRKQELKWQSKSELVRQVIAQDDAIFDLKNRIDELTPQEEVANETNK